MALWALVLIPGTHAYGQAVDNGCTDATGARLPDCSRLNKNGDRVTIRATDCGNPTSSSQNCTGYNPTAADENAAQCRTLFNTGAMDYFVPWKTPVEWGKFLAWVGTSGTVNGLSVHPCCAPQPASVCANKMYNGALVGPAGLPALDPATGLPIQLGKRLLGMRGGNPPDFGAQNDVSETFDAAALLGTSTINYQVTYVCNAGSWVKTFEEGSCTPMDGACGASVPVGGVTANQLASLQEQNLLCSDGSLLRNLVDHGTYWNWDCEGTPGRATAICTVPSLEINNGSAQCGTAFLGRLAAPPSTGAQLCTLGTPGGVSGTGTQADPWAWVCNGTFGSFQSCRAYSNTALMDGMCGASNGTKTPDSNWNPGTGAMLCGNGTQLKAPVVKTTDGWNWSCAGENGGTDKACLAELVAGGTVGWCGATDATSGTTPPSPTSTTLCAVGTPSAITYGPAYQNDGRMAWLWGCIGTLVPTCATPNDCFALGYNNYCQKYDSSAASPPACGWSANYAWYNPTPPSTANANLCYAGNTLLNPPTWNTTLSPPQWVWTCQGLGGATVDCDTNNVMRAGVCMYDTSNFTVTPTTPLPAGICGMTQSPINEAISGSTYTFDCPGVFGGATTHCKVGYDAALVKAGICKDGPHGGAHLEQVPSIPAEWKLCLFGAHPIKVSGGVGPIWTWTCQGTLETPPTPCTTIYNTTPPPPTATNGACGSANGSTTSAAPTSNLCSAGTATTVSGSGPWTWGCQGTNGGTNASCSANPPATPGAGACGTADGTVIPSAPNTNLCAGGTPSVVTGSGPWNWNCVGTTTVSCSADPCTSCAGDLPGVAKSDALPSQTITYGGGSCVVSGTVNWTQINSLSGDNAAQTLTFGDSASGTSFSKAVVPPSAPPSYCPPCYRRAKTITGSFTVQKNGTCTGSTLDSGSPATINFSNVQIVVP